MRKGGVVEVPAKKCANAEWAKAMAELCGPPKEPAEGEEPEVPCLTPLTVSQQCLECDSHLYVGARDDMCVGRLCERLMVRHCASPTWCRR